MQRKHIFQSLFANDIYLDAMKKRSLQFFYLFVFYSILYAQHLFFFLLFFVHQMKHISSRYTSLYFKCRSFLIDVYIYFENSNYWYLDLFKDSDKSTINYYQHVQLGSYKHSIFLFYVNTRKC